MEYQDKTLYILNGMELHHIQLEWMEFLIGSGIPSTDHTEQRSAAVVAEGKTFKRWGGPRNAPGPSRFPSVYEACPLCMARM